MLLAVGDEVSFTLKKGRKVVAPKKHWALLDDAGRAWPKCSLLIMAPRVSNTKPATDAETNGLPGEWLGKIDAQISTIDTPPKALDAWKLVGEVTRVYYFRNGSLYPDFFKHDFNRPTGWRRLVFLVKGNRKVMLYKRRGALRLELGDGCVVTERGLEYP